ncbi:restriction endonuclease, SacI family [Phenylobacterium sp. LjRoot225]|uniref:restriction endonuclease, SacI family n=1 Tax=Phenylobacterium sp. LjRoot225 TaxID=3342285 RepID=UPI003ECD9D86
MSEGKVVVDRRLARAMLYEEAAKAAAGYVEQTWVAPIEAISEAAEHANRTHIAFLGTAILAKCVNTAIDVFAVKEEASSTAYSARGLCHQVLVPNAPELDINLGVTGREPLNNQPYFRILRMSRDIPARTTAKPVVTLLCDFLDRLQNASEAEARQALRAFIIVRRRFGPRYSTKLDGFTRLLAPDQLANRISAFVQANSEGGRRAQAAAAGLMDIVTDSQRVDVRRVNDPSRSVPGDVNVRAVGGGGWARIFEVRDKPITREDLYVLIRKCQETSVTEAVMVATAPAQPPVPVEEAQRWAAERGVNLTAFFDWRSLVRQALLWAEPSSFAAAGLAPARIERRLIELEVAEASVAQWAAEFASSPPP